MREMFTSFSLLLVVGIALLMHGVGLSMALGAFIAGVLLADSEYRHALETDIEPFKGLLLGLFFITVGAGINFDRLFEDWPALLSMAILVLLVKGLVMYGLAVTFRIKGRDRWLFTLGLAQAGEFGFVLVATSLSLGIFAGETGQLLVVVIALSMALTPL
ncbi:MAG: cation:proton antiporter, partial [Pseudomonadota bacterium]